MPIGANSRSGLPLSQWTGVSDDDKALLDLLNTLWTWDTTLTKIIHRGVLHEHICSTASQKAGSGDYSEFEFCSRFLINAVLAVAAVRLCRVQLLTDLLIVKLRSLLLPQLYLN
jgi:hypothetical protein